MLNYQPILIVREHNKDAAETAFKDLSFTIVTGSRYLKGFIGEATNQQLWIQEKTEAWVDSIKELAMVAERYPQAAYEQIGAWLSVLPSTVNGTELSPQEFRDALFMR
jgi:hypothetical protein